MIAEIIQAGNKCCCGLMKLLNSRAMSGKVKNQPFPCNDHLYCMVLIKGLWDAVLKKDVEKLGGGSNWRNLLFDRVRWKFGCEMGQS